MRDKLKAEKELLTGPGDDIQEILSYLKWSRQELSKKTRITTSKIDNIISRKTFLTNNIALELEKTFGMSAQYWLNREQNYRKKLLHLGAKG
jgi:addiction module HigA family antidote